MEKLDRCATDAYLKAPQSQEVYIRESLKLLHYASSLPMGLDGTVRYVTRYSQSSSGYRGRVYAQGVALSKVPRRLRQISYEGMGARDWGVEMAYYTLATQIVDKLRIEIKCPYFNMDTTRLYIRDKHAVWNSLREHADISNDECKRLRNAVFSGETVAETYMANAYIRNIAREGRDTRWLACHLLSDVYGKLATDEKKRWAESSAQSYLLDGVEARVLSALAENCASLCGPGSGSVLEHLSLQFDGADIFTKPFPPGFKSPAESVTKAKTV